MLEIILSYFRRLRQWLVYLIQELRKGRFELATLVLLLLFVGGVWSFAMIADEVSEGETHAFDRAVLLAMRNPHDLSDPVGPKWVEELGRDFTALGGVGVLGFMALSVCGFMLLRRRYDTTVLILAAVGGGMLLGLILKHGFDRPRPELVPHETHVYTASFPSGHSMMAAVTYITMAALLARINPRQREKIYLMSMAVLLTVVVGISRVYLGVHWPTDILAGWTIGLAWALLCWMAADWLQRKGRIRHLS